MEEDGTKMANDAVEQSANPDSADWRSARRYVVWMIMLPLCLVVARDTIGGDTVLLREAPVSVTYVSYAAGLLIGFVLARMFWTMRRAPGRSISQVIVSSIFIVPLAIVTTTYLGRWAFEVAAFSGAHRVSQQIELKIVGVRGGKSGTFVNLRSAAADREIDAKITSELYSELAAIRPPLWSLEYAEEPFCMALIGEYGRWGAARAYVPVRWKTGLSAFHVCSHSDALGE